MDLDWDRTSFFRKSTLLGYFTPIENLGGVSIDKMNNLVYYGTISDAFFA